LRQACCIFEGWAGSVWSLAAEAIKRLEIICVDESQWQGSPEPLWSLRWSTVSFRCLAHVLELPGLRIFTARGCQRDVWVDSITLFSAADGCMSW
jgi:hypothetical protein